MSETLSILIPVYNEERYLAEVVERVLAAPLPDGLQRELVIVNDASRDNTAQVLRELCERHKEIRSFEQPVNRGKGAAIRRAIQEMTGRYAIIQDADLEYDPNDYQVVLKPLLLGLADVVYGSRFATREMRRIVHYHHKLGNLFLTHLSNFLTGLDLTDMETCYKAFRSDLVKTIPLRSDRFGIEPEITAKLARRGAVFYEVPISYHGRNYAEGKKIGWRDGVQAIWTILKYWWIDDSTLPDVP
ncbi:MAG: glycosyltransferase family 2 protein [Thermoguttaceae bacterium]